MMRHVFPISLALAIASPLLAADDVGPKQPLRVLYVGNKETDRARSYASFLGEKFTLLGVADRRTFDPTSVRDTDVVVLDWSQRDVERNPAVDIAHSERDLKSPLGERRAWVKPTVLLGSAGHLIAAPWKVFGGSG
jgi:hypothetical protein